METKQCKTCGEVKPLDQFNRVTVSGKKKYPRPYCKKCQSSLSAKWRDENPDKAKAIQAKWRDENLDRAKALQAKWRDENPDRTKAFGAKYQQELVPHYVAKTLNIPVAQLTPELLEAKREQLLNVRVTRQLIQTLKEIQNVQ